MDRDVAAPTPGPYPICGPKLDRVELAGCPGCQAAVGPVRQTDDTG